MRERPILFSGPMVRAILDGSKTQTRRVVKPKRMPDGHWMVETRCGRHELTHWDNDTAETSQIACPYGQPGDRLWLREAHWWFADEPNHAIGYYPPPLTIEDVEYRADGEKQARVWRPSIHMPRWASRITLEITSVRVERLQEISDADSVAEGCAMNHNGYYRGGPHAVYGSKQMATPRQAFRDIFEYINGQGSWDANPWVWAIEFKRVGQPAVGQEGGAA